MTKLTIIILTFLTVSKINAQSDTIYYENGNLRQIASIENNRENKELKLYYENGELKSLGKINKKGKRIGKYTRYLKNGQLHFIGYYNQKGQRHGEWVYYNENKTINSIENYTNGIQTGIELGYWKGCLLFKKIYNKNGILIKDTSYRESGIPLSIYSYNSEGKIICKEYFDENGKPLNLEIKTIIKKSCGG